MSRDIRLRWSGSLAAQREHENAIANMKRPPAKRRRRKKRRTCEPRPTIAEFNFHSNSAKHLKAIMHEDRQITHPPEAEV